MNEYPGKLTSPVITLKGWDPPSIEEWLESSRQAREREYAYNRSFKGRILNRIRWWRGCLSDWIAPEGWNDR